MTISNFDVLKKMCADNLDIRSSTSENILGMKKVKAGTQIEFGVEGDVLNQIYSNEMHCCLLIWNKKQFADTKKVMKLE